MKEQLLEVYANRQIGDGIFELVLKGDITEKMICGQFCNVQIANRPDLILKRPFGIAKWDKNSLTICYQIVGSGTRDLTKLKKGEKTNVTYPLGNGFNVAGHKKALLVGGGVGVFPLLSVASAIECHAVLGYRSSANAVYVKEFKKVCKSVCIATEDGTEGHKGYATDLVEETILRVQPDIILSCGPIQMLRSLSTVTEKYRHIKTLVSLEERMGCGIGACLVCACKIKDGDKIVHKRVCADGPVFSIEEAIL